MPKYIPKFKISLNLLYSQGTPLKWPAKILTWALSTGRYIGIAVEILVLATFAARFKFDADLADLKEKINQQIPYIESLQKEESLIKQTQFKIGFVKKAMAGSPKWANNFTALSNQTPQGIIFTTLTFNHPQFSENLEFKVIGTASSNRDLAVFLNGLRNDPSFKDVNLVNLSFDQTGLTFTITGVTK